MPPREFVDEKRHIEAMVTAILTEDAFGQAAAAHGLTEPEERYVRAGAGIIAGIFTALGQQLGIAPSKAWRLHMAGTMRSRGTDA